MTRVPPFSPFYQLSKFAEHPVDFFCFYFFRSGLSSNQHSVYISIAVSAAWLNYCGSLFLNSAFFLILTLVFVARDLAKTFDTVRAQNKIESEKIMATEPQVEKDLVEVSQKRVVRMSLTAFRIPKFALRPSIKIKIPSPTLFPRFVATPWFARV